MDFLKEYMSLKAEITDIRRKIHMNPELGFEEFGTAKIIMSVLDKYNISYKSEVASTGICAIVGKSGDKCLLIRADMDALPTEEKTGLEFASVNPGVMHACGHDMHVCAALTAAIVLKKHENELDGYVKFVFQPAEETTGGAEPMISEGVMENPRVTAAIGGHITAEIPTGTFKVKYGPIMASPDDFSVLFKGKSTHGAEPQNGISPIIPACEFVNDLEAQKKEVCSHANNVLSVCTVESNGGINTIPDEALILGTFRSFDNASRNNAYELLKRLSEEKAKKHNVKAEYNYNFLYPPVINDIKMTDLFVSIAGKLYGSDCVKIMDKPLMTGDDFSYFGNIVPAVYFWYGAMKDKPCALHSSSFNPDEAAIEVCANIFTNFAMNYLEVD